ncbi:MAG: hypothetical protein AAGE59_05970 [Cyanobacteria bacterium P01_F01_bin.86]
MSAALKSEKVISHSRVYASPNRLTVLSSKRQPKATVPIHLSTGRRFPLWLKLMVWGQWMSFGAAVLTVLGALAVYALTVDTNRQLTVATSTLERLQEQQQQLTAANAAFKKHLAETALMTLRSNTLHPRNVIFLEAVEGSVTTPKTESEPLETGPSKERVFPQGY